MWKIPEFLKGRVVLRIRYNITTRDFDYGSLANPVEEGAERTGLRLGPVVSCACSRPGYTRSPKFVFTSSEWDALNALWVD